MIRLVSDASTPRGASPDLVVESVNETFDWAIPRMRCGTGSAYGAHDAAARRLPQTAWRRWDRRGQGPTDSRERRHRYPTVAAAIFFGNLAASNRQATNKISIGSGGVRIRSRLLHECFHVRNVKKGAEPSNGLRDKLNDLIHKSVESLRRQIRSAWDANEAAEQRESGVTKRRRRSPRRRRNGLPSRARGKT